VGLSGEFASGFLLREYRPCGGVTLTPRDSSNGNKAVYDGAFLARNTDSENGRICAITGTLLVFESGLIGMSIPTTACISPVPFQTSLAPELIL